MLNNPFMSYGEVIASAKRGNQIAAEIRAGTYRAAVRSSLDRLARGYSFNEKWAKDAEAVHYLGRIR